MKYAEATAKAEASGGALRVYHNKRLPDGYGRRRSGRPA
jgi:hypothetical protein